MTKEIRFNEQSFNSLLNGVNTLANAVKITYGPEGKNVILERKYRSPFITKDGVTVAKEIDLKDSFENAGAQMVKEVALKTAEIAGDGTTTATILAQAIFQEGLKQLQLMNNKINTIYMKKGMQDATKVVVDYIDQIKQEGKDRIRQIATVSANNDTVIGNVIAEAIERAGINGATTVKPSQTTDTYVSFQEGMELETGYASPYFINPNSEKNKIEMNDAYVLIINDNITMIKPLLPILQQVVTVNKPLLIIASKIEGEALTTLILNNLKGIMNVCAVNAPSFGEHQKNILEDLAIMTGGILYSKEKGIKLEELQLSQLGKVKRISISKDRTLIENDKNNEIKEAVDKRIEFLKSALQEEIDKGANSSIIDRYRIRIAKLAGGVAVINVGAFTETEMKEKMDRIDDALHATKAAIEEGVVAGGGVVYYRAIKELENKFNSFEMSKNNDWAIGYNIIKKALFSPITILLENAGISPQYVIEQLNKIDNSEMGYNLLTGKIENMFEVGILDPAKVVKTALVNAVSISSLLLTSRSIIVFEKDQEDNNYNNYNN